MSNPYEVLTFGETMLRLSPPHHQLIEQAQSLDIHVGGSESNVAIGLARLGVQVAWFSALPDNPLGHYVERKIAIQGVDTSHVIWTDDGRLGIYWVEQGAPPRSSQVVYDRSHTAISRIKPSDLSPTLFDNPQGLLHLSGITPALSPTADQTTFHLLLGAKNANWQTSFDLNYRAKLWDAATARERCAPYIGQADIVFAPERDIETVFGIEGNSSEDTMQQFHELCPQSILIMTVGAEGAMAAFPDGDIVHESGYEATGIDRVGAGDAFVAGFLSQVVEQGDALDLSSALRWGNAMAALHYTIPGDMPLVSRTAVLGLLNQTSSQHIQR